MLSYLSSDEDQYWCTERERQGSYEVTGMSPQSRTVAQLLKGFVSNGTLYPPLKPTLREPMDTNKGISFYAVWGRTIN